MPVPIFMFDTTLSIACKRTKDFPVFDEKAPNIRHLKFLKPRRLQIVNACADFGDVTNFRLQRNPVVGVFLQRVSIRGICKLLKNNITSFKAVNVFHYNPKLNANFYEEG
jgi:hypothetical protein